MSPVYPRLRGGSQVNYGNPTTSGGLSPPTRGIPPAAVIVIKSCRSIPAYAGDPDEFVAGIGYVRVYPRLRGGSLFNPARSGGISGLSPPTRGIPSGSGRHHYSGGSIPAYAGDPLTASDSGTLLAVYPRLRGGSVRRPSVQSSSKGLSPPTRGIRISPHPPCAASRSIPAYAGDPETTMGLW